MDTKRKVLKISGRQRAHVPSYNTYVSICIESIIKNKKKIFGTPTGIYRKVDG